MKEKLKNLKVNVTLSALMTVLLGIVLIAYPGQVTNIFTRVIAIAILIMGAVVLIGAMLEHQTVRIIGGAVLIVIGIWAWTSPSTIASFLPAILGILMAVHGIQDIGMAIEAKGLRDTRWLGHILAGLVSVILGGLCVAYAFNVVKFAVQLIGIMLIFDGLSDMFIVHRVNRMSKVVDSTIASEEDLDDYDH